MYQQLSNCDQVFQIRVSWFLRRLECTLCKSSSSLSTSPLPVVLANWIILVSKQSQCLSSLFFLSLGGPDLSKKIQSVRALDLLPAIEVFDELNGEALLSGQLSTRLTQDTTDVVPWTLALWCEPDSVLSELDFTINNIAWDLLIVLNLAAVWSAVSRIREDEKEAVRPCRVVADIVINKCLDGSDLRWVLALRWEEIELANNVLAVRPDVVVLGVLLEHLGQKIDLRLGKTEDGGAAGGDG